MWIDDASGEVEDRVLPGQQSHRVLSKCAVHLSWFYLSAKEGHEQAPVIYQFPAGCELRSGEAHAEGGARLAHSTPDAGDVGRTGAAIQLGDRRVVGILRNLLSNCDARALSIYRWQARAVGQTQ